MRKNNSVPSGEEKERVCRRAPMAACEMFISMRYLFGAKKEKLVSIISFISMFGIAIGVAALIVVLAVMSGFDNELKNKIIGASSHITVQKDDGIQDAAQAIAKVSSIAHVTGVSGFIAGQAIAKTKESVHSVVVRGIDPVNEPKVSSIKNYLSKGTIDISSGQVIVGSEFAKVFGLDVGDSIDLLSPVSGSIKTFTVAGIFNSGMYDYDMNLLLIDIKSSSELFLTSGRLTGLEIKVDDEFRAPEVKAALQKELGAGFWARTWMENNKNLFGALKLEKITMFVILALIVLVASFNIASTLIMMVAEKTKDIGILKSIGAANSSIMRIFVIQGFLIGAIGTSVGTGLGLFLCWALKTYKFIKLPEDIYYISTLPVKIEPFDTVLIVSAALFITLVSTIYPARRASLLEPVEALKYE